MMAIISPDDMAKLLAERLKQRRLDYNWTREELSSRSDVTVASIRRFENKAEISLSRLLQLCFVLHAMDDFDHILVPPKFTSIAQLEQNRNQKKRQRARKKSS